MLDRIIGIAAIATLAAYVGILIGFVPEADLTTVLVVVVIMAAYDFYRALFRGGDGGR